MTEKTVAAYVQQADGDVVRIQVLDDSVRPALERLGFSDCGGGRSQLCAVDATAKAAVFEQLRVIGVAFSAGKEWCPAEVFEFLRDQGLLRGRYIRIAWSAPAAYRLSLE
ncbi:hypothetical protein QE400_003325 [Xanthomonas sacchari]|uniref:hypothetical protein n=1 Tax=Xanthomonas sacchari TaxID=56458 RepID=UPI002785C378|nr:hypothetical protein [Xanthomonas sacchari]MDQ1093912.1 hypothetical protein [Xanthomonas sacchari]